MKRPLGSWQNVWTKLGLKRRTRRRSSAGHRRSGYSRRSRLEPLEDRYLLDAGAVGSFERSGGVCWAEAGAYANGESAGAYFYSQEVLAHAVASAAQGDDQGSAEALSMATAICPHPIGTQLAVAQLSASCTLEAFASAEKWAGSEAIAGRIQWQNSGAQGSFSYVPDLPEYPNYDFYTFLYVATYGGQTDYGGVDTWFNDVRAESGSHWLSISGRVQGDNANCTMNVDGATYSVDANNNVLYCCEGSPTFLQCITDAFTDVSVTDASASSCWSFATCAWGFAVPEGTVVEVDLNQPIFLNEGDPIPVGISVAQGDFNADGQVDGDDFDIWKANSGMANVATVFHGDADGDRDVDGADYDMWLANFSGTPCTVVDVIISETDEGYSHEPYSFDAANADGSGEQLRTVPVGGANTITIAFSDEPCALEEDLSLIGLRTGNQPVVTDFSVVGQSATWTFDAPFAADQYLVKLGAGPGASLNWLDGEWHNPASLTTSYNSAYDFPSGDGTAGGDFEFVFNILPGDFNHDLGVGFADYLIWKAAAPALPGQATHAEGDSNGDGAIGFADYILWRAGGPAGLANLDILADFDSDYDADAADVAEYQSNPVDLNGDQVVDEYDDAILEAFAQFGIDLDVFS
jgi:hypothetical protein